ncbi:hypothetical protein DESC_590081 [Desulfosarcina cetonica]|nr:hypothetical protein DESC_590081 [Desulfosarcina cetonica]
MTGPDKKTTWACNAPLERERDIDVPANLILEAMAGIRTLAGLLTFPVLLSAFPFQFAETVVRCPRMFPAWPGGITAADPSPILTECPILLLAPEYRTFFDGFVKSPTSAPSRILRHCGVRKSTPPF